MRTSGPKMDEMIRGWRKLHNDEIHNLHSSPNRVRMVTSRRTRRARHAARMREKRKSYRVSVGSQMERNH
jgi:hypothetical protein